MILKDLPWRALALLRDIGVCRWEGYTIEHVPHKIFSVRKRGVSFRLFDVFGFFHCKYLTALKKYKVGTIDQLRRIDDGKNQRGRFTFTSLPEVIKYWQVEISLLPPLMDKVRDAAYDGGFHINEWHGPGALAAYALRTHGVAQWKSQNVPSEVKYATQSAYAGGRFTPARCGFYDGRIYTADINSAYIYACSLLPRMDRGRWIRTSPDDLDRENLPRFGLYKIAFDTGQQWGRAARKRGIPEPPYPLFHRSKTGVLSWPGRVEGWYWTPEAQLVSTSPRARILEAWIFDDDEPGCFGFVEDYYRRRLILIGLKSPAAMAYKWGMAAFYGAFARRVGWDKKARKAPRTHELAWAGWITSWCRAAVYEAAASSYSKNGLISVDTDGVTSLTPFDESKLINGVGTGLGQWKLEEWTGILYWQNGIYWMRDENGKWTEAKTRGVPKGHIEIEQAWEALSMRESFKHPAIIKTSKTTFIGYRQALRGQFESWRRWETRPYKLLMGGTPDGKCFHAWPFCRKCLTDLNGQNLNEMHTITMLPPNHIESEPHKLPWLEPPYELPEDIIEMDLPVFDDDEIADNL
jgi:hypothetical protein